MLQPTISKYHLLRIWSNSHCSVQEQLCRTRNNFSRSDIIEPHARVRASLRALCFQRNYQGGSRNILDVNFCPCPICQRSVCRSSICDIPSHCNDAISSHFLLCPDPKHKTRIWHDNSSLANLDVPISSSSLCLEALAASVRVSRFCLTRAIIYRALQAQLPRRDDCILEASIFEFLPRVRRGC